MKYLIRMIGSKQDGYYRAGSPYSPVSRETADKVDRKQVDAICAKLRKLGYRVTREEVR